MLKKRVDEMLRQMQKQYDSVAALKPTIEKPTIGGSHVSTNDLSATSPEGLSKGVLPDLRSTQSTNPNALKAESLPSKNQNKPNEDKPRAVMPKRN